MNFKLQKLITAFNERKTFFNNHPDAYQFINKEFGSNVPIDSKITISVEKPGGGVESVDVIVTEKDKKFIDSLSDILSK